MLAGTITDGTNVRYEYQLPDGTFADYVLSDRHGRAMAVVEAKRAAVNLQEAAEQERVYAKQLDNVPYVFLANGEEILFCDIRITPKTGECRWGGEQMDDDLAMLCMLQLE